MFISIIPLYILNKAVLLIMGIKTMQKKNKNNNKQNYQIKNYKIKIKIFAQVQDAYLFLFSEILIKNLKLKTKNNKGNEFKH